MEKKSIQLGSPICVLSQSVSTNNSKTVSIPKVLTTPVLGSLIPMTLVRLPLLTHCVSSFPLQKPGYLVQASPNSSLQGPSISLGQDKTRKQSVKKIETKINCTTLNSTCSVSSSNSEIITSTSKEECISISASKTVKSSCNLFQIAKSSNAQEENKRPLKELVCFVCDIKYASIELLQQHNVGKEFQCRVCAQFFDNHGKLAYHFHNHRLYNCEVCKGVFFSKDAILQHRQINEECKNVECRICKKTYYRRNIKRHMKNVHMEENKVCKCVICTKVFNRPNKLANHYKLVHDAFELLECPICKKLVSGPLKLRTHKNVVHSQGIESDSLFPCEISKKMFTNENTLKKHKKIHDTETLCELCGKSVSGSSMKYHMVKEHPEKGTYTCKICNKSYEMYYKLRLHCKTHHRKRVEDPVYCEICGKKYKTSAILKKHYAIHSDAKPFKCDTCDASFKSSGALRNHKRVHSNIGKYFCGSCGMSFKWKQTLTNHVRKCAKIEENDDGQN